MSNETWKATNITLKEILESGMVARTLKLPNRRLAIGYCEEREAWLISTKSLTPEGKIFRKQVIFTDEGMMCLFIAYTQILDELETKKIEAENV